MTPIFAIDPGNRESAWCVYYPDTHTLGSFGKDKNSVVRQVLIDSRQWEHQYAIEMIASYGMPVGADVFNTCLWAGRFLEVIERSGHSAELVYRKAVKLELCGTHKAKDSNIRQSILDRFPATGGGAVPQQGTKAAPGPLYGVSKDVWAALAVALTYHAKQQELERAA